MKFDALERSECFTFIFAEKVLDLFVHRENIIMFKVSTSKYCVTILTIVTIEMTMIMMLVVLIFDMARLNVMLMFSQLHQLLGYCGIM